MLFNGPDETSLKLDEKYLCLDFANTVADRGRPERVDHLQKYPDLIDWLRLAGVISGEEALVILAEAGHRPEDASAALAAAVDLREILYRIFSARAHGRSVSPDDLARLNGYLANALGHVRLGQRDEKFLWSWQDDPVSLERVLWPLVSSAGNLLASSNILRVGECDNEGCGWLFFDTSRNRSRRWCSMESCGNRMKAQRHYRRQKHEAP